jgi:hypothetical protein
MSVTPMSKIPRCSQPVWVFWFLTFWFSDILLCRARKTSLRKKELVTLFFSLTPRGLNSLIVKPSRSFVLATRQGDQIGQIFGPSVIAYFGTFFGNWKSSTILLGYFFRQLRHCFLQRTGWATYISGDFFAN